MYSAKFVYKKSIRKFQTNRLLSMILAIERERNKSWLLSERKESNPRLILFYFISLFRGKSNFITKL